MNARQTISPLIIGLVLANLAYSADYTIKAGSTDVTNLCVHSGRRFYR
jgi:hypothetical protein